MNEVAIGRVVSRGAFRTRLFGTRENRRSGAFYGYSMTIIAIGLGWLARDHRIINPEEGLGYWLGIVGGSLMLFLLLYPMRKRIKILRIFGSTKDWFRLHIILGIVGPLLVLYHCNFHLGSFNSQMALMCMLLVAGSGMFGLHIYARIHRGLYGKRLNLDEARSALASAMDNSDGLAKLMPNLMSRLESLSAEVQGDKISGSLGTRASLAWTLRRHVVRISLWRTASRELRARAAQSATVARDYRRLRRASSSYIGNYVRLMGQVAQLTLYEKMFSLWHVLHLPLFYMLVISALLHVLAVHMY